MEKNNVSLELEEMRLQMAALQKQLNERLKFDEQQLQNSTMKKINAINRYGYCIQFKDLQTVVKT